MEIPLTGVLASSPDFIEKLPERAEKTMEFILNLAQQIGYLGIISLMFLESSFFPFPSEVVMIPAGMLVAQGKMDIWMAIFMGILGSWLGALFNYYLALWLGRPFIARYGRYFFLPGKKFNKVETFFLKHGEISTFTGRLIPVIRQYISFPAGLARMNIVLFLLFTGLGAGLWVSILVFIGYGVGKNLEDISLDVVRNIWHQYSMEVTLLLLLFCALTIGIYTLWYRKSAIKKSADD